MNTRGPWKSTLLLGSLTCVGWKVRSVPAAQPRPVRSTRQ